MSEQLPPPGWYPAENHDLRWWDGARWTEHVTAAENVGTNPPQTSETPRAKKKVADKDWWLGRTEQQQQARARLDAKREDLRARGNGRRTTPNGDRLAKGLINDNTAVSIYRDGTFTTTVGVGGFGKESDPDRLIAFEHESDSMRRKSVTGRAIAFTATVGVSAVASNNRGVLYVTITGERTGVNTYTKRNPSGTTLSAVRSLKAAAQTVLSSSTEAHDDVIAQIERLAELRDQGLVSEQEFEAKKSQLLERL